MKTIRWLVDLADIKPVIFSLAMLLIAVSVLAIALKDRDDRANDCNKQKELITIRYQDKVDSLYKVFKLREEFLDEEVKKTLGAIIEDYKRQLEEQKNLNKEVNKTINKNHTLIDKKHQ